MFTFACYFFNHLFKLWSSFECLLSFYIIELNFYSVHLSLQWIFLFVKSIFFNAPLVFVFNMWSVNCFFFFYPCILLILKVSGPIVHSSAETQCVIPLQQLELLFLINPYIPKVWRRFVLDLRIFPQLIHFALCPH